MNSLWMRKKKWKWCPISSFFFKYILLNVLVIRFACCREFWDHLLKVFSKNQPHCYDLVSFFDTEDLQLTSCTGIITDSSWLWFSPVFFQNGKVSDNLFLLQAEITAPHINKTGNKEPFSLWFFFYFFFSTFTFKRVHMHGAWVAQWLRQ